MFVLFLIIIYGGGLFCVLKAEVNLQFSMLCIEKKNNSRAEIN